MQIALFILGGLLGAIAVVQSKATSLVAWGVVALAVGLLLNKVF